MKSLASSLMVVLFACIFCAAAQAAVTVLNNDFRAHASLGPRNDMSMTHTGVAIPTVPDPLHVDAVIGEAHSKNVVNWTVSGGQTVFSFDTDLKRIGVGPSSAYVVQFALEFAVDEDAPYQLSGFLNVTDVGETEGGYVNQSATLYDSSAGVIPFSGQQQSVRTHDEEFILGGLEGDEINQLHPGSSLMGMLFADHTYTLSYLYMIAAEEDADSGASAVGNLTLKIGTVPEPSAVALCAIFAVLGLIRRRPGKSC
jgi:hypothetical protein